MWKHSTTPIIARKTDYMFLAVCVGSAILAGFILLPGIFEHVLSLQQQQKTSSTPAAPPHTPLFRLSLPTPTSTVPHTLNISPRTAEPPAPTIAPTGVFLTTKYITIQGVTNNFVTIPAKTIDLVVPTCIHTITPDKNGFVPPGTCGALYNYYPSFTWAVVASIVFGILAITHTVQAVILKQKFFWMLIMGACWAMISFIIRAVSTRYQQNTGLAIVSDVFGLISPFLISAFTYMVLARMVHLYLPTCTLCSIPAFLLSITFFLLNCTALVAQLVGSLWAGPISLEARHIVGRHISIGGIVMQQFFLILFLGVVVRFHLDMRQIGKAGKARGGWKKLVWGLYASIGLTMIQTCNRLAGFCGGSSSSNPSKVHEGYVYALEAVPLCLAILVFKFVHPGNVLKDSETEFPDFWSIMRQWICFYKKNRKGHVILDEDCESLVDLSYKTRPKI